jgi:uncharacterized protein (TIGR02996 family)
VIQVDVLSGPGPQTAAEADHTLPTRTITLAGPEVVVAATPDADVVLKEVGAIRLKVVERDGTIVVEDLTGRHPTRTVELGALLRLGKISVRLSLVDAREHQLLTELRAAPDDALTRSVYADWLEEHDKPERAEFLRAQLAAATATTPTDPAFLAAAEQIRTLRNRVGPGWRAAVGMVFVEHCPVSPNTPPYPTFTDDVHGLELVCPMKWEQLAPTAEANVRACGICKKDVTLCTSFVEVVHHTQRGHCVAIELSDGRTRERTPTFSIGVPKPRS